MAEVSSSPMQHDAPSAGLASRLIGVVFAPRDAYTAVDINHACRALQRVGGTHQVIEMYRVAGFLLQQ